MKLTVDRPYSDPEKAARTLVEIANTVEVVQDGRIYTELINGPFLFREKGTPEEYRAAWIWRSSVAGWICTKAERSSGLRPAVPSYSPTAWVESAPSSICSCASRPIESGRAGGRGAPARQFSAVAGCQLHRSRAPTSFAAHPLALLPS